MRYFIYSMIFLSIFLSHNVLSNNSVSVWPLIAGNMWLLEDEDNVYNPVVTLFTDSVTLQEKQYFYANLPLLRCNLFREDSIGDIYTFKNNKDQLIFPFGTQDTNYFHFTFNDSDECWIKAYFKPYDSLEVFPGLKGNIVSYLFDYDTIAWDDETFFQFVTSVGPIKVFTQMGPGNFSLRGCIINGKEYGVTETTNPEKPHLFQPINPADRYCIINSINRSIQSFNGPLFTPQGRRITSAASISKGVYILKHLEKR